MRNNGKIYVISVESRKGGVGKTTFALNLARILLNTEKYEVMYLDFDLSGTAAGDFVSALKFKPVWQDIVHQVDSPTSEKAGKAVNLIDLFEYYMTGEKLPEVKWLLPGNNPKDSKGFLLLKPGCINILSSYLDRPTHKGNNGPKHFYGPEVLFDELHSEWFISMTRELVQDAGRSRNKKLVVIIDNSPGYTGLQPRIEDWLTTLGPECGKFLFVGSLDTQDMNACIDSIRDIHELFCEKWTTSREFLKWCNKNVEHRDLQKLESMNERMKRFFTLLAEPALDEEQLKRCSFPAKEDMPGCVDCGNCYYRQKIEPAKMYTKEPSKYISLVMNKVPREVFRGDYEYNMEPYIKKDDSINDVLKDLDKRRVPLEDAYVFQYIADKLKKKENEKTTSKRILQDLNIIEVQRKKLKNDPYYSFNFQHAEDALFLATEYNKTILKTIDRLEGYSLSYFFSEEFKIFNKFSAPIVNVIGRINALEKSLSPIDMEEEILTAQNIAKSWSKNSDYTILDDHQFKRILKNIFLSELIILALYEIDTKKNNDISIQARSIRNSILVSLMRKSYYENEKEALTDLYVRVKKEKINNWFYMANRLPTFDKCNVQEIHQIVKDIINFSTFLVNMPDDFDFVLNCFRTIVSIGENASSTEIRELKDLARDVLIERTTTHKEGNLLLRKMGSVSSNNKERDFYAVYMARKEFHEFENILNPLLKKQWELA